jgi:hypothetical protein
VFAVPALLACATPASAHRKKPGILIIWGDKIAEQH